LKGIKMLKPTQKEWDIMRDCLETYLGYIENWDNPNNPYQELSCAYMEVPMTIEAAFGDLD
jgi:hypothetical protein